MSYLAWISNTLRSVEYENKARSFTYTQTNTTPPTARWMNMHTNTETYSNRTIRLHAIRAMSFTFYHYRSYGKIKSDLRWAEPQWTSWWGLPGKFLSRVLHAWQWEKYMLYNTSKHIHCTINPRTSKASMSISPFFYQFFGTSHLHVI